MGKNNDRMLNDLKDIIDGIPKTSREEAVELFVNEVISRKGPLLDYMNLNANDINFALGELKDPWGYWKKLRGLEYDDNYDDMTYSAAAALKPHLKQKEKNPDMEKVLKQVSSEIFASIDLRSLPKDIPRLFVEQLREEDEAWKYYEANWIELYALCARTIQEEFRAWRKKSGEVMPQHKGAIQDDPFGDVFYQIYLLILNEVG